MQACCEEPVGDSEPQSHWVPGCRGLLQPPLAAGAAQAEGRCDASGLPPALLHRSHESLVQLAGQQVPMFAAQQRTRLTSLHRPTQLQAQSVASAMAHPSASPLEIAAPTLVPPLLLQLWCGHHLQG